MHFFTLISKHRGQCQILLFLLCVAILLSAVAAWNQAHWTPRQKERATREDLAGRLDLMFENGNISPRVNVAVQTRHQHPAPLLPGRT